MDYAFSESVRDVLAGARQIAQEGDHGAVQAEHIFLSLAEHSPELAALSEQLGLDWSAAREAVAEFEAQVGGTTATGLELPYAESAKKVLVETMRAGRDLGDHHVDLEHILVGLLSEGNSTSARVLTQQGLDRDKTLEAIAQTRTRSGGEAKTPIPEIQVSPETRAAFEQMSELQVSPRTRAALERIPDILWEFGHESAETEHILLALLRTAPESFRRNCDHAELERVLLRLMPPTRSVEGARPGEYPYAQAAVEVLKLAFAEARRDGTSELQVDHMVRALIDEANGVAAAAFRELGIESRDDWVSDQAT